MRRHLGEQVEAQAAARAGATGGGSAMNSAADPGAANDPEGPKDLKAATDR
jgi:hypothetical protein